NVPLVTSYSAGWRGRRGTGRRPRLACRRGRTAAERRRAHSTRLRDVGVVLRRVDEDGRRSVAGEGLTHKLHVRAHNLKGRLGLLELRSSRGELGHDLSDRGIYPVRGAAAGLQVG